MADRVREYSSAIVRNCSLPFQRALRKPVWMTQANLTDNESRILKAIRDGFHLRYRMQMVVDARPRLIKAASDTEQLTPIPEVVESPCGAQTKPA